MAKTKDPGEAAGGGDPQGPPLCAESSGENESFPGRNAGLGQWGSRERSLVRSGVPEVSPAVERGRRGREGPLAPVVPYIRPTLDSSAGGRMGRDLGDCCCPENATLCHPGAEAAAGALPLLRGRIFFGCAAGGASLTRSRLMTGVLANLSVPSGCCASLRVNPKSKFIAR